MYILFDIGGTKTRIAATKDLEIFSEPDIFDTPHDFKEMVSVFGEHVKKISQGEKIEGAAGGVKGPLNKDKSELVGIWWIGEPLKKELERAIGAPVFLENDSAIVGLGEAVHGAGKGHDIVAYMTISTGVGGARIVHGHIDEASTGFEPGHQIIDPDKTLCMECSGNTLEMYISGKAVEERTGKKPYEILNKDFWNTIAKYLAYGLNNLIVYWSPDAIVLGGSMMKEIGIAVDDVKFHLKNIVHVIPELPEIKKAELADIGGLYGAMEYLKQSLNTEK